MPTRTRFAVAIHTLAALAVNGNKPLRSEDLANSVNTGAVVIRGLLSRSRIRSSSACLGRRHALPVRSVPISRKPCTRRCNGPETRSRSNFPGTRSPILLPRWRGSGSVRHRHIYLVERRCMACGAGAYFAGIFCPGLGAVVATAA